MKYIDKFLSKLPHRNRINLTPDQCGTVWVSLNEHTQSGSVVIRSDIKQWLEDNNIHYQFIGHRKQLCFLKKNDAIMFQLTWVE